MRGVRRCTEEDIPQLVALRNRCFQQSEQGSSAALAAYFRQIFFDNPWQKDDFPSLVYEDATGGIIGFIGVIPRPFSLEGNKLWLAVPTQFMTDPEHRGLFGIELMRAFLSGPQDFSLADLSNDDARRIWERLGGCVARLRSLYWIRPLRPARFGLRRVRSTSRIGALSALAKPLCTVIDAVLLRAPGGPYGYPLSQLDTRTADPLSLIDCYADAFKRYPLFPDYNVHSLGWLFERLHENVGAKFLRGAVLSDSDGHNIGWYLYVSQPGGVAQTIQISSNEQSIEPVLQHLLRDASQRGAIAIAGRLQPEFLTPMAEPPAYLTRRGPWVLVHARQPELLRHILSGNAWVTRLEGEWWLNF